MSILKRKRDLELELAYYKGSLKGLAEAAERYPDNPLADLIRYALELAEGRP